MFFKIYILFWFLLFGGVIGSFLNVVIYRLPLGKNLSFPPSFCPKCQHPIRWFDNVPVFGWIRLQGKCRDCKAPISFRYPLIEALCAFVFVFIGWFVLNSHPIEFDSSSEEWFQIFCRIVSLAILETTLLTAGMIEYDQKKVPLSLFVPVLLISLLALALGQMSVPFAYCDSGLLRFFGLTLSAPNWYEIYGQVVDACLGGIGGFLFSFLSFPFLMSQQRISWSVAMFFVGFFLGWQLVLLCALVLALYHFLSFRLKKRTVPTLFLFGCVLLLIATSF